MRIKAYKKTTVGTRRCVWRFLLVPMEQNGYWHWLWFYKLRQEFVELKDPTMGPTYYWATLKILKTKGANR